MATSIIPQQLFTYAEHYPITGFGGHMGPQLPSGWWWPGKQNPWIYYK